MRRYVVSWAMVAGALVAVAAAPGDRTPSPPWLVVTLGVLLLVLHRVRVDLSHGEVDEATTLVELGVVPVLLLLSTPWALALAAATSLLADVGRPGGSGHKVLFNVATSTAAMAAGTRLHEFVVGGDSIVTPRGTFGAVLGATAFVVVNQLAFCGLVAVVQRRSPRQVWRDGVTVAVVVSASAAAVGVLLSVLAVVAPAAIPLALLPLWAVGQQLRSRGATFERITEERQRFEATVEGATDGVVLLDVDGTVRVWNTAIAGLTGLGQDAVLGRTLRAAGLGRLATAVERGRGVRRVQLDDRVLRVDTRLLPDGKGTLLVVEDITRDLEQAQLRDDLTMRVSHELRTPLTTISGFIGTLDRRWGELDDARRLQLVRAAERGTRRLNTLVVNLLAWARIEQDAVDRCAPQARDRCRHPAVVLQRVLADVAPAQVQLEVDPDVALPLSADDLHLVAGNLVANAVTYGTPPLAVTVGGDGRHVWLRVVDHGPGISAEVRQRLGTPFSQPTHGLRRTDRGLGLGLAVVRALVEASGGRLEVVADDACGGNGRGTTVTSRWEAAPTEVRS